jgi:hypothetical protein
MLLEMKMKKPRNWLVRRLACLPVPAIFNHGNHGSLNRQDAKNAKKNRKTIF